LVLRSEFGCFMGRAHTVTKLSVSLCVFVRRFRAMYENQLCLTRQSQDNAVYLTHLVIDCVCARALYISYGSRYAKVLVYEARMGCTLRCQMLWCEG
jgi:hypothetical protein